MFYIQNLGMVFYKVHYYPNKTLYFMIFSNNVRGDAKRTKEFLLLSSISGKVLSRPSLRVFVQI